MQAVDPELTPEQAGRLGQKGVGKLGQTGLIYLQLMDCPAESKGGVGPGGVGFELCWALLAIDLQPLPGLRVNTMHGEGWGQ